VQVRLNSAKNLLRLMLCPDANGMISMAEVVANPVFAGARRPVVEFVASADEMLNTAGIRHWGSLQRRFAVRQPSRVSGGTTSVQLFVELCAMADRVSARNVSLAEWCLNHMICMK
jgi:hypothetical protein